MNNLDKQSVECPECKEYMDEIKSIDFNEKKNNKPGNGKTYFYCEKCKISVRS
jgi:hypothetical protein